MQVYHVPWQPRLYSSYVSLPRGARCAAYLFSNFNSTPDRHIHCICVRRRILHTFRNRPRNWLVPSRSSRDIFCFRRRLHRLYVRLSLRVCRLPAQTTCPQVPQALRAMILYRLRLRHGSCHSRLPQKRLSLPDTRLFHTPERILRCLWLMTVFYVIS